MHLVGIARAHEGTGCTLEETASSSSESVSNKKPLQVAAKGTNTHSSRSVDTEGCVRCEELQDAMEASVWRI